MPVSHDVFMKQVDRLIANYRPGEPTDRFGDWLEELFTAFVETDHTSDESVTAAVSECIRHRQTRGLPTVAELRLYVEAAWRDVQRTEEAKALPAPPARVVGQLDPSDPYSCTPEERERWAKEDKWLRAYAAGLKPTPPELLERMSAEERARCIDFDERNAAVANWPNLRPAERRAKEQRIAAAKARVPELIAKARRETRARLDAISAARAADTHPKAAGGKPTVTVNWQDGVQSVVELSDRDAAMAAKRAAEAHWTAEDERALVAKWPHLQKVARA